MWLKVHNPQEFYTTLLTERPEDISKIDKEARLFNVRISPPDINKSSNGFTIDGDKILFGLEAIKGIGEKSVDIIAEKRPYTSVEDFRSKTPKRPVSSAVVTALEKSGAFDEFGVRDNWSAKEILEAEEEILGIALSKEDLIYENIDVLDLYIEEEESLENKHEGYNATIGGEIDSVRVVKTKNGDPMAFVDISYMDSAWSVTVFPGQWIRYRDELYQGANVMIKGDKNTYNGKTSYVLNYIMPLDNFLNEIKEVESVNT
jgi:DNA polymerase III alpha subunit